MVGLGTNQAADIYEEEKTNEKNVEKWQYVYDTHTHTPAHPSPLSHTHNFAVFIKSFFVLLLP